MNLQHLEQAIGPRPSKPTCATTATLTKPLSATSVAPIKDTTIIETASNDSLETEHTFPSLLRYTDNLLMQNAALHNQPPPLTPPCPICQTPWNETTTLSSPNPPSTFLPLTPCNHWLHYRCLISRACDPSHPLKNHCPTCHTQLYTWDAITALTLATRSGIHLLDTNNLPAFHPSISSSSSSSSNTNTNSTTLTATTLSDTAAYEADCALIVTLIHHAFFEQLALPSQFQDASPDLVRAYREVVWELERRGVPRARWLRWCTGVGWLLFGMLVFVKMRRVLEEEYGGVLGTEAWGAFEGEGYGLRERLLDEVHGEGSRVG